MEILGVRAPAPAVMARDASGDAATFESPLFEGRADGFAYVCRRGACLAPVDNIDDLLAALDDAARAP